MTPKKQKKVKLKTNFVLVYSTLKIRLREIGDEFAEENKLQLLDDSGTRFTTPECHLTYGDYHEVKIMKRQGRFRKREVEHPVTHPVSRFKLGFYILDYKTVGCFKILIYAQSNYINLQEKLLDYLNTKYDKLTTDIKGYSFEIIVTDETVRHK